MSRLVGISDIAGETGQKIVRAIIAGERDRVTLARLKNGHIRASEEAIARSLHGNWRTEHLFTLAQAVALFDAYGERLQECDRQLECMLAALERHTGQPAEGKRRSRARNAPKFDVRAHLFRRCGVDLTGIDGIDVTTALKVVAEVWARIYRASRALASCWAYAEAPRSPEEKCCRARPSVPATESRKHCVWPPRRIGFRYPCDWRYHHADGTPES